MSVAKLQVRVEEVVPVNELITRFRFVSRNGAPLPAFSGGAHTVVEMEDHGTRRMNPYSLMSDPSDTRGYEISVRRDDQGRGGSLFMHRHVRPGMEMVISNPVNLFGLDTRAKKHLMIVGGIGITPFLSQTAQLARQGGQWEMHYAARNRALGAYMDRLTGAYGDRVHCYFDEEGDKIDLARLLATQPIGTHLYVCGPKGMIAWVLKTAAAMGWPPQALHSEEFIAPPTGAPFEVQLAASGKTITVGPAQSLLEAIEAAGVDAPYLCRGGACGQCETNVLRHEGEILHADHWLTDEEKASNCKIMPCVSRFAGKTLVLDR
ncbi:PDR/VanB family oxidoreductase [Xinfangfangia sp. CPCC 101601]|uniref:PDR/VanB family oxidoreductase n=1 Tax=Pseudogemmobacter lacusdianii TaxID=3069608 RepID=A0ABU0VWR4_9RHOB|nr:PDR/VanB family oxidoreductase [Xinfangfangia sp. CPCC 101601]MDQ2066200.1 PDR/VanB family oxidoreductase [Xinfangfangia sp. CPCC 101601]